MSESEPRPDEPDDDDRAPVERLLHEQTRAAAQAAQAAAPAAPTGDADAGPATQEDEEA